ncbi:MAG: four helix bundle protein [Lewinellaceae bacterium]|nr:four helix bundle protein [Saprospiraceae bacterium]MCB9336545.1 four helix bundle protein [Lewinellaceae bacterium]
MSEINRFEDLDCWKAARILVKNIFVATRGEHFSKDWDTRSQIRRAALSSMNNIAEGFGRFGKRDKPKFFDTAKASAMEVKSMLYFLGDVEYLPIEEINELFKDVNAIINLTNGFIKSFVARHPELKQQ